jgi:hypothetical protein
MGRFDQISCCRTLGTWLASACVSARLEALRPYTTQNDPDFLRVTRADWCFDFYSPALKAELHPGAVANVVCHSSAKKFETQTVSVGDVAQTTYGWHAGVTAGAAIR